MAKQSKGNTKELSPRVEKPSPRTAAIIAKGDVKNSQQFIELMCALMSDAVLDAIKPSQGNIIIGAGRTTIRMLEAQAKYGPKGGGAMELAPPK